MEHILSILHAAILSIVAIFGGFFAGHGVALPMNTIEATSTPVTTAEPPFSPSTPVALVAAQETPRARSTASLATTTSAASPAVSSLSTVSKMPAEPAVPVPDPEALNARVRSAVVNIFCTVNGNSWSPISGSGVIIDPRGVILTNAHVAQYFLLEDYPSPGSISCTVRTGSPARAAYTARLLYLSSQWIRDNASKITTPHPTGTGQYDFAFLLIDGTASANASLPASFPFLSLSAAEPAVGDNMLLASYPAGFLEGIGIHTNLFETSAYSTTAQLFIFEENDTQVGLFSIPGSVVSQSGSSGGAAVRTSDGTLAGIIVTDTDAATTDARDLRALTIGHITQALAQRGVSSITELLSGNLFATAGQFYSVLAPGLTQQLVDAIKK